MAGDTAGLPDTMWTWCSCFVYNDSVADLSKAQRSLSKTLIEFRYECIGSEQTDDEIVIGLCFFYIL